MCHLQWNCIADLPSNLRVVSSGPGARHVAEDPRDVVVLVKHHASDANLAQEIQLAVPFCRLERISPLPTTVRMYKSITVDCKKNWLELVHFVLQQRRSNLQVGRTARFLLDLINSPDRPDHMVPLPWLEANEAGAGPPSLPDALDRLAPVIKFKAVVRR